MGPIGFEPLGKDWFLWLIVGLAILGASTIVGAVAYGTYYLFCHLRFVP